MSSIHHPTSMKNPTVLVLALAAGLLPGIASSVATTLEISRTGQPTTYLVEGRPYHVTGYGHATFGMGVEQVKALVAADFPAGAASLKDEIVPGAATRALTLVAPELAPGPGPATMTYVFGASSHKLIAINIDWRAEGQSTTAQRAALVEAAKAVASSMAGWRWPVLATTRGAVLPGNTLIVFAGHDAQHGGVEIRLDGVDFDVEPRAKTATSAATSPEHRVSPPGPARLHVAFVANTDNPDIYRIPDGAF